MLDINEEIENNGQSGQTHLVYKEGVKVKYPDKNGEVFIGILPAFDDPADKTSYLPYRDKETMKFTQWAAPAWYYPFVNKEKSILSPRTFDKDAWDPVEELIRAARSNSSYAIIAGYEPDGKRRMTNAFGHPEVRLQPKTQIFCVNAIILFDKDIPDNEVMIVQIPSTAFKGQGQSTDGKSASWGLISKLNQRNRNSDNADDFDDRYYWGDITNPQKIIPVKLSQEKPPTGSSFKIYDLTPVDDEDPIKVGKSILEQRYNLDDIFVEIDTAEVVDYLISSFADKPVLLKSAFSNRVPNIEKLIKKARAKYSFSPEVNDTESDSDNGDDEDFELKPRKQRKHEPVSDSDEEEVPSRRFTPPAMVLEDEDDADEEENKKPDKKRRSSIRDLIE